MRYADVDLVNLPDNWLVKARQATLEVLAKRQIPDDDSDIWRGLKSSLASILHNKCWFCETPISRSDNAVDHFRPKGRVADAIETHEGYRWLAFELGNFRYACTFCNSHRVGVGQVTKGGKADRFPLLNEDDRVYEVSGNELDFDNLLRTVAGEKPKLLDPCSLTDWKLLGCLRENGKPCSTSEEDTDSSRVQTSIEVYHLHHEPTCKQRHHVAVAFLDAVREAKNAFLRIDKDDPVTEDEFSKVAKRVRRCISETTAYSGEMIFLLRGQRSAKHPWIQEMLEN